MDLARNGDGPLLARAARLLGERCGLRFDAGNQDLLRLGLERAAAAEGAPVAELLVRLEDEVGGQLAQAVLRHITIGETYLFRHPEHFRALEEVVVPALMQARPPGQTLRGWSAGCASGEEAWSLASLFCEVGRPVQVLGTDINRCALEAARRGVYGAWSVRNGRPLPPGHFTQRADGGVEVAAPLRRLVRFDYLNLKDPIYPSLLTGTLGLDLVLCRNVLVYFFADAAKEVVVRLCASLAEGGFLLLSALDLSLAPPELERIEHAGVTLLRRPLPRRAPLPVPVPAPRRPTPPAISLPPPDDQARRLLAEAKAAADRGDLELAEARAGAAVAREASAEALHLHALILAERGQGEAADLRLGEAVRRAPDYVLGHLALGLSERLAPSDRAAHLRRVLTLLDGKRDEGLLPGPDPLPVAWVRKMAGAALGRLAGAEGRR
jgi:chemotaxis protein methyltransferase CheR